MKLVKCPKCRGVPLTPMQKMTGQKCGFCFGIGEMEMPDEIVKEIESIENEQPKRKYTKKKDLIKDV